MRARATNRGTAIGLQLAILVAVIALWEVGTNTSTGANRFLIDPFIWSRPWRIVGRVGEWLQSGIILNNVFFTLYDGLISFVVDACAGAMVGAVVGEYLGAARGLGHVIAQSEGNLDATGVWAGMLVLCVVVVVVEVLVTQLERRLVRWKPRPAGELLTA